MDAVKLLGALMGNKSLSSGLGGKLLSGLMGGGGQQSGGSPLASILSGVLGGGGRQSGSPMAGLLGGLLGGGGLSGLLGSVMGGGQPEPAESQAAPQQADANEQALLMIRAMVNAAKSDGRVDQSEQENIISKLGNDVDESEIEFLRREFASPLDVESFARSIPKGMEQQIYAISLTSIELDTQNEANYLGQLAQGLQMDPNICNQIHEHLGAPKIFG